MADSCTDGDLEDLLGRLDLDTKIRLISGAGRWETTAVAEIGLAPVTVSDGPIGVRGTTYAECDVSAAFPSPSAMAATWDEDLLARIGAALAAEAARKGVDVVLGPTINLHRSPLGGRHFECFSEDPHLTGRMAAAYVRGLQDSGVGACPKHYVTNEAETERFTVDNRVEERVLRELYLAPFEVVVEEAEPWMIMAAYNATNGAPMSENALLGEPLKGEWGWDGAVVSDWGGVYSTVPSALASLDLAMPGPEPKWGEPLLEAVRSGAVDEARIDEKVRRILRLAWRAGALQGFAPPVAKRPPATVADAAALAREAAGAAMVLLKNDGTLPLERGALRRVALVGPNATEPRSQGGGSARVFPPYVVAPLPALRAALGDGVDVVTVRGASLSEVLRPPRSDELDATVVRWLDERGEVVAEEPTGWGRLYRSPQATPAGAVSFEMTTRFLPSVDGTWRIGVSGIGSFELEVEGATVLEENFVRDRKDLGAVMLRPPQASVPVDMRSGTPVTVRLRYRWLDGILFFAAGLGIEEPQGTPEEEIARAVEAARSADVAVVLVGTSELVESEGVDRRDLRLPGRQDELVAAVAEANRQTVVVVNAGSPVEMPWLDRVGAALVAWFPGMEFGHALVDVLLGDTEPGGRLPTTWPATMSDAPVIATTPTDGKLTYDEGLHIGYRGYLRNDVSPAFWFGHGLGYTEWTYEELNATPALARVRLRNSGERPGKEVVQIYTSRPDPTVDWPARVLSGFAVVRADPGRTVEVEIPIDHRTLRHWDPESGGWKIQPGPIVVHAGPSSNRLPLQTTTGVAL